MIRLRIFRPFHFEQGWWNQTIFLENKQAIKFLAKHVTFLLTSATVYFATACLFYFKHILRFMRRVFPAVRLSEHSKSS